VFDGTNDYMARTSALTGSANSKNIIVSAWFKITGGDGSGRTIIATGLSAGSNSFYVQLRFNNTIRLYGTNSGGSTILTIDSNDTFLAGSGWHHILLACQMNTAGARHLYIDNVENMTVDTFTNDSIALTGDKWDIGANRDNAALWFGELCEIYVNISQYIDITQSSNRLKFRSATAKPVDIGSDGSTPTGTAPIVYLKDPYTSFGTNSGTGGNFTVTGALAEGTPP